MSDLKDEVEPFVGDVKHEFTFSWTIENCATLTGDIASKEFSLNPMCSSSWNIILKEDCSDKFSMSVGLKRTDKHVHSVSVECSFTLRNSKGTPFIRRILKAEFVSEGESKFSEPLFSKPSKSLNVIQDAGGNFRLCSDDKLIVEGKIATVSCCYDNEPVKGNISDLQRDLVVPLRENLFVDVNFIIGSDNLPAHKFMLAARSPVFRRMFEADMKENADSTINITDIEKPVLELFLMFIYTGTFRDCSEDIVLDLYSVADKYDVCSLQDNCRHKMVSFMSNENVCHILNIAYNHNDEELKDAAFSYLCDNFIGVEQTKQWQTFAEHNPTLAAKAVCKFASKLRNM